MQKVRELQIRTRRMVTESFAGEYSSAFKGRGMEFAEVREYQPGDDIRTIDWNVTARAGAPFIKKFVEERELTVILAVDLSASGRFGSIDRLKNETAAEICAVLAFTAVQSNDKVGLLIFTDEIELFIPPKKGMRHVLRLIRELLDFDPRGRGTDIVGTLEYLGKVLRRHAVVFLVSDFLTPEALSMRPDEVERITGRDAQGRRHRWYHDLVHAGGSSSDAAARAAGGNGTHHRHNGRRGEAAIPTGRPGSDRRVGQDFEGAINLIARRHDLIAVQIVDERERRLAPVGLVEIEDAETGDRRMIDTGSRRVRADFAARAAALDRRLEERWRRLGVDHLRIVTHESYVRPLAELFRRRERRR